MLLKDNVALISASASGIGKASKKKLHQRERK